MKRVIVSFLIVVGVAAAASPSYAQDLYVSSSGVNTGACLRSAPCATFGYAFAQLAANGVIHVVDQGAYGPLTITHGVTIDGGGISTTSFNGGSTIAGAVPQFAVAAGAADVVTIANFTISGENSLGSGAPPAIGVTSVGALHVEHCTFVGFTGHAIDFRATGALLDMKDVTITDMPNANGVYVSNARATLEHVSISRTQSAVIAAGSSTVTVTHSTFNGNSEALVAAYGPTAELHVDDCTITNNEWAVVVSNGASAYVSRSSLFNNFISALFNDGSSHLVSYGDNRFVSNASDGAFTSTASVK